MHTRKDVKKDFKISAMQRWPECDNIIQAKDGSLANMIDVTIKVKINQ